MVGKADKQGMRRARAAPDAGPASGLWHLAAWRSSRGWTQEQLAERIGTTKATISKLESGARSMSEDWIKGYVSAFGIEPADLLRQPSARPLPGQDASGALNEEQARIVRLVFQTFLDFGMTDPPTRARLQEPEYRAAYALVASEYAQARQVHASTPRDDEAALAGLRLAISLKLAQ